MDARRIEKALGELAEKEDKRTDTAKLREIFDRVEDAINAGFSVAKVHEILQSEGFSFTFRGFETSLFRIRKERKEGRLTAPQPPARSGSNDLKAREPASLADLTPKQGGAKSNPLLESKPDSDNTDSPNPSRKTLREQRASEFVTSQSSNPLIRKK